MPVLSVEFHSLVSGELWAVLVSSYISLTVRKWGEESMKCEGGGEGEGDDDISVNQPWSTSN